FIVEEREPVVVDRDLLWFVEDWRLDDSGCIAPGFGNRMEAGMSGRIGNTITINGRGLDRVAVKAGGRGRLRVVNAALARIVGLRFEGHRPVVISHDGQPCEPYLSEGGRLVLGPAMRADLIIDMDDGVDAPRRHLRAKVTVSNCHRRRRPWSRLPRSVWISRRTCSSCMERMLPGMCSFASASLARSFSVS